MSAATRLPAVLTLLAIATACAPAPEAPPPGSPSPTPAGEAAYREVLHTQAGLDLGPRALAERAAADAAWLSARMDALARRLDGDSSGSEGWRAAFEPLRADHPPDAEAVLAAYRREAERARAFVDSQGLVTIPPIGPGRRFEVVETPEAIPDGRYTFVGYLGYRLAVTVGDGDRLRDHCRVCIPPLAVHEAFPGHHVAFLHQRSGSAVDRAAAGRAAEHLTNPFFHEGWGTYAEVLMLESGYYDGSTRQERERELSAWRSLLFRTVRARIDPLLHLGEMSVEEAVAELEPFLDRATAEEEVARHLAEPGAKAAYHVGLLQVLALREAVRREAEGTGKPFDLRAFHDRLVRLPGPIPELARERFGVELPAELPRLQRPLAP